MSAQQSETLDVAASRGDLDAVKSIILAHRPLTTLFEDDLEEYQEELNQVLSDAACTGHSEIVSFLLDHGAQIESFAAIGATKAGPRAQAIFQAFLNHGWDINAGAIAPSMFSPRYLLGPYKPVLGLVVKDERLLKWFLENGADPNFLTDLDDSPLTAAAAKPTIGAVELLLSHGAKLQCSNALHSAVGSENQIIMMQYLLDHGASVNALKNQSDPGVARRAPQ